MKTIKKITMAVKVSTRAFIGRLLSKLMQFLVDEVSDSQAAIDSRLKKVNQFAICSFFARKNGISYGAEWQIDALRRLNFNVVGVDITQAIRNPFFKSKISISNNSCLVIHVDGPRVAVALNALRDQIRNVVRIGYCAWELPDPPLSWGQFDRALHEVWVPSEFCRQTLQKMCVRNVRVVRHVVPAPSEVNGGNLRRKLGLSDQDFVVLAMVDVRSSLARKNPFGAIHAFKKGLGNQSNAVLVLKVTGADHDRNAFDSIVNAAGDARVVLLLDRLTADEQWQLYAACDVFISLHCAEGYGLPMAEAMAVGRVVVATGWSGNMDFMTSENSALVNFKLIEINDPQGHYSGSFWAEPDVDHAATILRDLYNNPALRESLGAAAANSMGIDKQIAEFKSQVSILLPVRFQDDL